MALKDFEEFLQYGDLVNAKIIFVGMEEGFGREGLSTAIKARYELLNSQMFTHGYVNRANRNDGWYIPDSRCLGQAEQIVNCYRGHRNYKCKIPNVNNVIIPARDQTMTFQAKMHWILQGKNRNTFASLLTNSKDAKKAFKDANQNFTTSYPLHMPGVRSAMIDYFPLPNQKASDWPDEYMVCFQNRNEYKNYYLNQSNSNNRVSILSNLYNKFCDMPLSIVYAGRENSQFRLEDFYTNTLNFRFSSYDTSQVNHNYPNIPPSTSKIPNPFKIGTRTQKINGENKDQTVVLTTFFGQGQISDSDIAVISTWLP